MSLMGRIPRLKVLAAAVLALVVVGGWRWAAHCLRAERGARTIVSGRPLVLSAPPAGAAEARSSVAKPNVIICVLDAARADHTGCYGYPRDTTPNLDKLARDSLVFERHYAEYPQTKASTASLLTSRHADNHLAVEMREVGRDNFFIEQGLKQAGFSTAYFNSNAWASPSWGFAKGFDAIYSFAAGGERGQGGRRPHGAPEMHRISREPEALLSAFSRWLDSNGKDSFFAYLHFLPPHHPYNAPEEMRRLFAGSRPPRYRRGRIPFRGVRNVGGPAEHEHLGPDVVNKYDANLRYADWAVGELVAELGERGLLDKTLLIITSDHGETLGEHGYRWHPACPFEEALHIPLLIRFPGGRPAGRVSALTQSLDLLPTIYELLRLPVPTKLVEGRSLMPLITGEKTAVHDYLFSRTGGDPACYVVRDLRYSLLLFEGGKLRGLYDLKADPWQRRNIIRREAERADRMADAFRRFALTQRTRPLQFVEANAKPEELPAGRQVKPSEDMKRELKALGYLK
jgi:arylsulfatase A-like enzyme